MTPPNRPDAWKERLRRAYRPDQRVDSAEDLENRLQDKRARWENNWQVESDRPESELAKTVPAELKTAVESGWFAPGSAILDIGSGHGQISAWLAERGYRVLGADFIDSATELARRHWAGIGPNLEFRTIDILEDTPEEGRFDALVDQGCFHGIFNELHARYVEKVAQWAKPGAKMLLFHTVRWTESESEREIEEGAQMLLQSVPRVFAPWFELESAARAIEPMERPVGPIPRETRPAVVFRFVRREARVPTQ